MIYSSPTIKNVKITCRIIILAGFFCQQYKILKNTALAHIALKSLNSQPYINDYFFTFTVCRKWILEAGQAFRRKCGLSPFSTEFS